MSALTTIAVRRCAATALCVLAAASLAQSQPVPPATMPAEKVAPALLPAEVPATNAAVGARHRCGGIGSDESIAMRAQMKEHSLSLLFAQPSGAYLADIDVTTIDQPNARAAGAKMADMLLALINGKPAASLQELWQPALLTGATTGPAAR